MTSRLLHYAAEPFKLDRAWTYDVEHPVGWMKPPGFWFSVEGPDDWPTWCRENDYGLRRLRHAYEVRLVPDARILRLSNATEFDAFTARYFDPEDDSRLGARIAWEQVARDYQGIVIAPYAWSRRLTPHTFWFYGWDCASGCVWDLSAVESLRVVDR